MNLQEPPSPSKSSVSLSSENYSIDDSSSEWEDDDEDDDDDDDEDDDESALEIFPDLDKKTRVMFEVRLVLQYLYLENICNVHLL